MDTVAPPVTETPMLPGLVALLAITTLRNATAVSGDAMVIALPPPVATMLPTSPGTARTETDLVMVTVLELKLAESSIHTSPPLATAAIAAGSSRHGACSVHGLPSLPVEAT